MPYLNLKLCAEPSQGTADQMARLLTDLTAELLNKKRELTAVAVEFIAPSHWSIGGTSLAGNSLRSFHLDIKVTAGTNTKDEKTLYVARVFAGIEAIAGALAPASYIVIHEVHADAWGYQGQTQEFRYIRGKAVQGCCLCSTARAVGSDRRFRLLRGPAASFDWSRIVRSNLRCSERWTQRRRKPCKCRPTSPR